VAGHEATGDGRLAWHDDNSDGPISTTQAQQGRVLLDADWNEAEAVASEPAKLSGEEDKGATGGGRLAWFDDTSDGPISTTQAQHGYSDVDEARDGTDPSDPADNRYEREGVVRPDETGEEYREHIETEANTEQTAARESYLEDTKSLRDYASKVSSGGAGTGPAAPDPLDLTAFGEGAVLAPNYDAGGGFLAAPVDLSEVTYVPAVEHSPHITDPSEYRQAEMSSDESEEDEDAAAYGEDPAGYGDAEGDGLTAADVREAIAVVEDSLPAEVSESLSAYVDGSVAPSTAPAGPSVPSNSDPFARSEYDWDPSEFKEVEAVDSIQVDLPDDLFEDG
jgi:hypothetical protein